MRKPENQKNPDMIRPNSRYAYSPHLGSIYSDSPLDRPLSKHLQASRSLSKPSNFRASNHADEELGLAQNWDMVLEANYSLLGLTGSKSLG